MFWLLNDCFTIACFTYTSTTKFTLCCCYGFTSHQQQQSYGDRTFLAHLSQRLIGELIGCSWSGVRRSSLTISNIFFSKTACPIKAKFYVEPPWVGGTEVCSRHLGHMTKMAATPIYGKNPSKIFSRTGRPIFITWCVASGTPAHHSLFK